MCWYRLLAPALLSISFPASADYLIGAGIEGDSDGGLGRSLFGDLGLAANTRLSTIVAHSGAELPDRPDLDSWFADLTLDHLFDPVGVRAGIAYWGDDDVLESVDWRGSLYWNAERFKVSLNGERRDFDLVVPSTDFFPGRKVSFDANGLGLSGSLRISQTVDLYFSGLDYDYSVNLRIDDREALARLLTATRLSLINSLVDFRVSAGIGVDVGQHRLSLDVGTWRGEVDGGDTTSATLRWLLPLGRRTDLELGLGHDDSELYGEVTFFSVYLFYYGGN